MFSFILVAIIIVVIGLAIITRPLLQTQAQSGLQRDAQNILFAKARLAELDEQLSNATITLSDHASLKQEIETTLLHDINLDNSNNPPPQSEQKESNGVVIALLCTLIPFGALSVYQITGTPAALDADNLITPMAANNLAADGQDIIQMVAAIEQALQDDPDDLQGWTILARTYLVMGRYHEAVKANLQILKLSGESAAVYTQLADATALAAGGEIAGQASEYIDKAIAIDPQYPQALWLAGLAAAQAGDAEQAQSYWNTLLPLLANAPEQQQELRDIIAQTVGPQADAMPNDSVPAPTTASEQPATSQSGLTVSISIDPAIRSCVQDSDTVFVFARAQNGPPAPLAVKRLTVADLPTQIELTDNDAMLEQFKLSLFSEVVVVARISVSGNPIAQKGDIQSNSVVTQNTNPSIIELLVSDTVE